jgi:hypothetical protein
LLTFLFLLLSQPVSAQFGVAGQMRKKAGTSFQELNDLVKEGGAPAATGGGGAADALAGLGDLGDLDKLQEMMAKAFEDPETMKALNSMGDGLQQAMEEMGKMDPAQLQKQMEDAMKLMTQGDVMDSVLEKKDEVLANLEQTGLVSAEELAKYKADPAYFEEQMKSAFSQMQGLFSDPDMMKSATEAMKGMQDAMSDPVVTELQELLMADSVSDLEIETMRLKLLQKGMAEDSPALAMFGGIGDELKDADKFKKGFYEGRSAIKELLGATGGMGAGQLGAGAGMGEL